jgi:release factor glutamine methyltransferase
LDGSRRAAQEAGWLLRAALGIAARGAADPATPVPPAVASTFAAWVERRRAGEPLAYVLGTAPFLDFELAIEPGVLIPRGDTELLARWATARLAACPPGATVVDVGTGSGALAIALARRAPPGTRVVGTDTSRVALEVAARNVHALAAGRVELVAADLLPPGERIDLVVANLPYVGRAEMAWVDGSVARFEPAAALFAPGEPLALIRRLLRQLSRRLAPFAAVGLEIGWRQAPAVLALVRATWPRAAVRLQRDAAGRPRVVTADLLAGPPRPGDPGAANRAGAPAGRGERGR